MKKKVLICAYSCVSESGVKNIGGEAELGWNIAKQLSRFFEVFVLTHYNNKESIEKAIVKDSVENIKFFYIKLPGFLSFLEKMHRGGIQIYSYLWQIKAFFVVKKLHNKLHFDVFHHVTYANDWMASYIGAFLAIPYIRGPGGGAHKVPEAFVSDYPLLKRIFEIQRGFGQWVFRHDPVFIIGHNRAKKILVCNKEAFDNLKIKWKSKTEFFPVNGILKSDFESLLTDGRSEGFSVITAGKLMKIKGFDLAIEAFKIFNKKYPNSKLDIIGDGPELKNLKKIANQNIVFKNWMPRKDLLSEICKCDVFIFSSLRDGGGAVVVEAMACAKPVICFDVGGPGFHIDDKCGIKIKPINPKKSIQDMASALEKLYLDRNLRDKLGDRAKEKAENNYDWDKLGERLLIIYKNI